MLVVDEGHKAKNTNTKFRKALKEFQISKLKVILTGTPVQNRLDEFYSLLDLVQDNVFGSYNNFKQNIAVYIERGMKRGASQYHKQQAMYAIARFKEAYDPIFLRRTKKEIFSVKSSEMVQRDLLMTELPLKTDIVVWIPLSEV